MREQRFKERSRPQVETKKPPKTELQREVDALIDPPKPKEDLQPAKAPKNIATKNRKRVAEAIGKSRDGKVQFSTWMPQELMREVRIAAIEDEQTIESFVDMAIRHWLEARKA